MIPLTLHEIAAAVDGVVVGDESIHVSSVVADSREVIEGSLFVCIPGERVDGHDFAEDALKVGAVACLSSRAVDIDMPCVVVTDVVLALGRLAHWYRMERLQAAVVAITGSSGKTTTKDLLAQILNAVAPTVAPKGSLNTEVGLPLTVLSADADTRFLVLEMGMRGIGHIAELMAIARPSVGVLLNIGSAHVGVVGSHEAIAQGKGEILEGLPAGGTAIVNSDDPAALAQISRTSARVLLFGQAQEADVRASEVTLDETARPHFVLQSTEGDMVRSAAVALKYAGEHVVSDALAAASAALCLGLSFDAIVSGLESAQPQSRWRMEVCELSNGVTLINDAYNANPESMRAALKTLTAMAAGRRTWAVLGEMLELGQSSVEEHDAIGRLAVRLDVSKFLSIGSRARVMHLGATQEGSWGDEAVWVADTDAAIALLREDLRPGDIVLVKASRSIGLERVADAIQEMFPPGVSG